MEEALMAALPYIQLYVADYLADTAHLTAAQHGAYLLLIMNYWQRGQSLNNSNERLTNVARMSSGEWEESKHVLQEFFKVDGDIWTHDRIERDLAAVYAKSTKASNAGKASAQQKANKRSTSVQQTLNHTDTDTDTDTDTEETKRKARVRTSRRITEVKNSDQKELRYRRIAEKLGREAMIRKNDEMATSIFSESSTGTENASLSKSKDATTHGSVHQSR
jgi:uncharacterized protein YdaU (DUF1376 family)